MSARLCVATNRPFCKFGGSLPIHPSLNKGKTMKNTLATTCFIIGTLLAPVAVLAEDPGADQTQPMTYVKDSIITTKIKAKLAEEKMSSLVHVNVDTDSNGAVVLSGNVSTQEEADKAILIARETDGVTSVTSNLKMTVNE
jgi:hyperosmotically inducible protein